MANHYVAGILTFFIFLAAKVAFAQLGLPLFPNIPLLAGWAYIPNENGQLYLAFIQPYRNGPDPTFNATRDVSFLLYTRRNPDVGQNITASSIASSNFNAALSTRIVIHGWLSDYESPVRTQLVEAFLDKEDVNVIFVNWGPGSRIYNYPLVRYRVQPVADVAIKFFNSLIGANLIRRNEILLAGHSLGAHIAGLIGKQIQGFQAIVGLDPAGPLFYVNNATERLASSDANDVQVIHTSGGTFGMMEAIGKSDFYPNGGVAQPPCGFNITCYHGIAFTYYAESVNVNNFKAAPCGSYAAYLLGKCPNKQYLMGGDPMADIPDGTYYLCTNTTAPYGQG